MSQGIPSGYVLPTPQRAKLVGTLNIVFALLVMMYILVMLVWLLMQSKITDWSQNMMREGQAKADQQRKDHIATLKKEVAEAKTAEEKTSLKQELDALEKSPAPKMPDLKKFQDQMMTPGYMIWMACDLLSGLALNVAMLVSGIGLLRLKEWGRKLGNWTFGLKIARLCILTAVAIVYVIPMTSKMSAEMVEGMTQGKAAPFPMGDMAKFQAVVGMATAVIGLVFGSIWPVVGLVLLTRPGTRAACRTPSSKPVALEPELL